MLTRNSRIFVGNGREEIHPLSNPDVLCNIFRHMDVETLKSVRQTCTFWKEEANSLLQKKSKITINWYRCRFLNQPTIATFMKYVESVTPENVFFRNYELFSWRFHSREEEVTQFWLKCGQHIRNLTLQNDVFGFYEQSYVQNVFSNWTPNMESLQIKGVRFLNDPNYTQSMLYKTRREQPIDEDEEYNEYDDAESYDSALDRIKKCEIRENIQPNYNLHTFDMAQTYGYQNFPLQWKELFVSYPNLVSLSVYPMYPNDFHGGVDNIESLLTELIEFQDENPDKLPNLKHLDVFQYNEYDFECLVRNDHFEQAIQLKFKLESLRIHFESVKGLSYDTVGKYIAKLSPTLKTLKITSKEHSMTVFPPVGKKITFPNLKELSITLKVLSSNNLEFLESTPALEKLMIGYNASNATEPPRLFSNTITIPPLDSLRHLKLKVDILTEDCIQKIGVWFPNLSYFGATLDDSLLWAVYKFLYNSVEELKILDGKGVTDAGITGVEVLDVSDKDNSNTSQPKPSSSKKSQSQEPLVKRRKFIDTKDRTHVGTSIRQMKKLRRVSISAEYKEPARLTDDSVHNGFILLPELSYLYLRCSERITEEALRDLYSRPNFTILQDTRDLYTVMYDRITSWNKN